jgi:fatty-acyl-CoA synthase
MALRFMPPAAEFYDYPLTIGHLLDAAKDSSAGQEIVYRDQIRLNYREFKRRIGKLASMLAQIDVVEGTTVAVLDWDSHRYLEAYFAIPMMGAVLQTVNIRLAPQQIAYTLAHAEAQVLLVHQDFLSLVESLLPQLPRVQRIVALMDGANIDPPLFAVGEYEALMAAADPNYAFQDFDENAVATTFHTSGTTGDPKAVCFTHRQIVLHVLSNKAPFGVTRARGFGVEDVYMPITPMFHVHAWGMPYIATLLGVKQVYPGRYDTGMLLSLRDREKVTFSHCVPTILKMLLDGAKERQQSLQGWMMLVGGSALSKTLFEEARQQGVYVIAGYGMSESGPRITLTRPRLKCDGSENSLAASLTTIGVPAPLASIRVVDEAMHDVPHDGATPGEIVVRAPWLTPGYVGDPAGSAALWRGGWLHTQDIATIDEEGFLDICDRIKDVIKSGGEWISSVALENLIIALPEVAEVSVVGVPDARWGERPIAAIVPHRGSQITLENVNNAIRAAIGKGALNRYALIDRVEVVDSLPKTSVGKIDKKVLRTRYSQPTNRAPEKLRMP